MEMNKSEVIELAKLNDIRLVRYLYCDLAGVIRGKTVHGSQFANKLDEGVGLTRAQNAVNLFEDLVPVDGMEPVGEVRIVPDPNTFTILPWLERTAGMLSDLREQDGSEWGGCTRSVLKRALAFAASHDIEVMAAFESEFYLAEMGQDGPTPWQNGPCYSSSGMDRASSVVDSMVDNLTSQGIVVEQAINEYGPGQQEIAIKYGEALFAADSHLKFRDTIRGTAEVQYGLLASLAPKPFADGIGSGAHLHFSLWSKSKKVNLLYDAENPTLLSEFGKSFVAGVLDHLPALLALTCPSFVSYHRLKPHSWAGSTISWGYDNRECAVRVASPFKGREMQSINLELKTSDGSNNPYLALAGVILAGLDGVSRGLKAPEPAEHDPVLLTDEEKLACNIRFLPKSQLEALDALENDPVLMDGLGELMSRAYLATRRAENAKATSLGDEWARLNTFSTF
jgi:glutamine synthetase